MIVQLPYTQLHLGLYSQVSTIPHAHSIKILALIISLLFSCFLRGNNADSIEIRNILAHAQSIESTDRDSALILINTALEKSKELDDPSLMANTYRLMGTYMFNEGKSDSALVLYNTAIPFYYSAQDSMGLLKIYYDLGTYYSLTGDYQTAIKNSYKSLEYAHAIGHKEYEIYILESIGVSLGRYKDHEEEVNVFMQALEKAEAIRDTYSIAHLKFNISTAFVELGQDDLAMQYVKDSESLSLKHGFTHLYGLSLNSLVEHYYDNKEFEKAKLYLDKIDSLLINHQFNDLKMRSTLMKSNYSISKSEYRIAMQHGQKALELLSFFNETDYELRTYDALFRAYKGLEQFDQAILYLEKHNTLKDSIVFNDRHHELKSVQVQYETAQKDVEIKEQQIIIQNQKNRRQFMLGGVSFLGVFGMSIFLLQSQRLKKNRIISAKEAAIQSQQITQLEKEKKILSMSSMIEGQESERKRIAQDLHDGLGGLLATIKVKFGIIQKEIAALESMNLYQQTTTMIDDACTEVRKIAHNMMPDSLTKLGLVEAVRDIAEYTSDMDIKLITLGTHTLSDTQEIMLYRIIQEFINNSRKHANAKQIIIQFSSDNTSSIIYLEDDGDGFDATDASIVKGLGLKSIESRVNFISGTHELDSTIGVGTTLQIKIPI